MDRVDEILSKLESGFFGFWVKRWRVSFLFMALLIFIGLFSIYQIPKESSPDIDLGIIAITVPYPGANPKDIDNLITEKIESAVVNIDGVKKVTSQSRVGASSVVAELQNDADISKALVDIKDAVDKVALPADAFDPIVIDISTDNERMFSLLLYADADNYSQEYLWDLALYLKNKFDGVGSINRIDLGSAGGVGPVNESSSLGNIYDIYVLVDKNKSESLGLSILQISNNIRGFNSNQPLGNHKIGDLNYDFRIQGELKDIEDLKNLPIFLPAGGFVLLSDIAAIKEELKNSSINKLGKYQEVGKYYVSMTVNKKKGAALFTSSSNAKEMIEKELRTSRFDGVGYEYTLDLSELINDDYNSLAVNGLWTIAFVFAVLLFFVGFKEALIASISVPLAFMVTFFVLNRMGLSMNFLTNLSLIVCFGIAIDATIVVVQGAHEKLRQGYNTKSAVLLSVKDYAAPLISGTATTLVVFLPMMVLPGIIGKFLAYIPITIFITLFASLFIALTINSALYYKFSKKKDNYENIGDIEYLPEDERFLLEKEREGKNLLETHTLDRREKILDDISNRYADKLAWIMKDARTRILAILIPIVLLVLSMIFLVPMIGFNLFPASDSPWIFVDISARRGVDQDVLARQVEGIDDILSSIEEVKIYYYNIRGNAVNVSIELFDKKYRRRDSFQIEEEISSKLDYLTSYGLQLQTRVQAGGPPVGSAVGIKLVADSNDRFETMLEVARDFEAFLNTVDGARNVKISSSSTPGQFVFSYDIASLANIGIRPADIQFELFAMTNGVSAGSIKQGNQDNEIRVKYADFDDGMSPSDVMSLNINTQRGKIGFGSIADYVFDSAINEISREDGNIVVSIESDIDQGSSSTNIQSQFTEFANQYSYPDGVSFQVGGENQENSDLIEAMLSAFVIAIFLIFAILLLQFNSFLKPSIILYSVLLGLLGANIGLWVTGNTYSIAFMIGFIALTGIVVNNAIVLIDRIDIDISRGKDVMDAIIETGKSRLAPISSTAMTTVLGLISVSQQDKFFAGLGYTIIFGLLVASSMTLFVVPALYYDKDKIIKIIKRVFIVPFVWILLPFFVLMLLIMLGLMFGFRIWNYSIFPLIIILVFVVYAIWYGKSVLDKNSLGEQTYLQKLAGISICHKDGSHLSRKDIVMRFVLKLLLLFGPAIVGLVLGGILSLIVSWGMSVAMGLIVLLYLVLLFYVIYKYWINDDDVFLYDEYLGVRVEEETNRLKDK